MGFSFSRFQPSQFYPVVPPTPFVLLCVVGTTLILGLLSSTLLLLGIMATLWALYAYADPPRTIPQGAGLVLSPLDGCLVAETRGAGLPLSFDQARDQQEHFLRLDFVPNLVGARTFRAPLAGTIREILRWTPEEKGGEADQSWSAMDGVAILVEVAPDTEYALVFEAPLIPRQIHLIRQVGDKVEAGDRLGVVLLYARAALYIRDVAPLLRRPSHHVRAGETVLQAASFQGTPLFKEI